MNDGSQAFLVWRLTSLQLQREAVIAALENKDPGFRTSVAEHIKQLGPERLLTEIDPNLHSCGMGKS